MSTDTQTTPAKFHSTDFNLARLALFAALPDIVKDAQGNRGKYADLPAVCDKLYPVLAKCGFYPMHQVRLLPWSGSMSGEGRVVTTITPPPPPPPRPGETAKPQEPPRTEEYDAVGYAVATRITHAATGEHDEVEIVIPMPHPATAHHACGAITYASRYGLLKVTGAYADDDDDAQGLVGNLPALAQRPPPAIPSKHAAPVQAPQASAMVQAPSGAPQVPVAPAAQVPSAPSAPPLVTAAPAQSPPATAPAVTSKKPLRPDDGTPDAIPLPAPAPGTPPKPATPPASTAPALPSKHKAPPAPAASEPQTPAPPAAHATPAQPPTDPTMVPTGQFAGKPWSALTMAQLEGVPRIANPAFTPAHKAEAAKQLEILKAANAGQVTP